MLASSVLIAKPLEPVALLHQGGGAPLIDGIRKPMKPGGYRDSSADIAFALRNAGIRVVTPIDRPDSSNDEQWSFPDTEEGIEAALELGARTLWANTVLYTEHPLAALSGVYIVGQRPENVQRFDDKWTTNELLKAAGCSLPRALRLGGQVGRGDATIEQLSLELLGECGLAFPLVVKPVRGRGSEGVIKVDSLSQLREVATAALESARYGNVLILEEFLEGEEITISVLPTGHYSIHGRQEFKPHPWALPPVRRFNHHQGIAPYNGTVAVMHNSAVMSEEEIAHSGIQNTLRECERAAGLVGAVAPIRVDCRQDSSGQFRLFDLNMKPNMTGAGRPGREEQDSLTCLAARSIGWDYTDLLLNMLDQAWID